MFSLTDIPYIGDLFNSDKDKTKDKGKENPELDKTKEALKQLKSNVDVNIAFETDLDELGIKDPKERERHKQILKERLIAGSPELAEVDKFVDEGAKYAKLDVMIEEAKKLQSKGKTLEERAKSYAEKAPEKAGLLAMIITFFRGKKDETKEPSWLDKKLDKFIAYLNGEKEEPKTEEQVKAEGKTPEQQAADKKGAEALAQNSREAAIKAFKDAGLTLNEETFSADVAYLYGNGKQTVEAITALAEKTAKSDVLVAMNKHMGDKAKTVPLTLTDAYFFAEYLDKTQTKEVTDNMPKIVGVDPNAMRNYLNAAYDLPNSPKAMVAYFDEPKGKEKKA